ncbi:SGNH/GDSL hydrolase family protein, partial [Methylobacterium sp. B1]|uniref:SGNH/GDSL hydrolase family protein n=1 Tax=Methylobacterium sp. B1 TaxID=91459 RepID=UPI0035B52FB9
MRPTSLYWLPIPPQDWRQRASTATTDSDSIRAWSEFRALSLTNLDHAGITRLAHSLTKRFPEAPSHLSTRPVRLAVLGSSTTSHLLPSIKIAALRRGIWITFLEGDYGQYVADLETPSDALRAFAPDAVLLALDARHLTQGVPDLPDIASADNGPAQAAAHLHMLWQVAQDRLGCRVIQQTVLPVFPPLFGGNEHRMPGSRHRFITRLNAELRKRAESAGVDLVAVDD